MKSIDKLETQYDDWNEKQWYGGLDMGDKLNEVILSHNKLIKIIKGLRERMDNHGIMALNLYDGREHIHHNAKDK